MMDFYLKAEKMAEVDMKRNSIPGGGDRVQQNKTNIEADVVRDRRTVKWKKKHFQAVNPCHFLWS